MSSGTSDGRPGLRARLQQALRAALQARDSAAVSALRSAQAAIGNAEAVVPPPPPQSPAPGGNRHFAGSVGGLGAAEAPRRVVTEQQASEIVRGEIAERHDAADLYERFGHADRAARLRREADALRSALTDAG